MDAQKRQEMPRLMPYLRTKYFLFIHAAQMVAFFK
jgi:hypothetical protein